MWAYAYTMYIAHALPFPDIRTALKAKDDDYVKLLKRQAADVDTMLAAMGQQLSQMTAAFREELQNVEGTLLQVCRNTPTALC